MAKKQTKKIDESQKKIIELEEQVKRSLADYQNLEKRTAEERGSWIKKANKDLVLRLLPVLDTLMLANAHVQNEGLMLSIKQFLDILRNEGIEKIETEGQLFDPVTMEGVGFVEGNPSTGSGPWEGKVVNEIRAGFRYNGEAVLRPAQVLVGSAKQNTN